ncbi:hypothetical protein INT45_008404 [Circinella minor]|uniref:RING-type domain-containing protein n=1 Tax=Circinella minor TaxID=1195481 RepID=A0A8H7RTN8_9FUNG|nr:hypothetical protein INT45_008404 [Circinella minor]
MVITRSRSQALKKTETKVEEKKNVTENDHVTKVPSQQGIKKTTKKTLKKSTTTTTAARRNSKRKVDSIEPKSISAATTTRSNENTLELKQEINTSDNSNVIEPKSKKAKKTTTRKMKVEETPKKMTKKESKKAEMERVLNEFPPELRTLQGRLYRMSTERMIVVQRTIINDFEQQFDVLGSTGNELIEVFSNCTPDASVIVNEQIQRALEKQLYGKEDLTEVEDMNDGKTKQRPLTISDCPVCFDEFTEEDRINITFCQSCGNNIHKTCFDAWSKTGRSKITCVYCRAEWNDSSKKKEKTKEVYNPRNEEGYVNVGSLVGMPETRDGASYGLEY